MDAAARDDGVTPHEDPGRTLAAALSLNALFSTACGLGLMAVTLARPALLGPPAWLLAGLGVGLIAFAVLLLWVLSQPRRLAPGGWAAFAADLMWVAGAVALLGGAPGAFTGAGSRLLVAVTLVVAVFAAAQAVGLRRIRGTAARGTTQLVVRAERVIPAPPGRVWAAVADVADYARHTSTIADTEILSGEREGMVRVCTDRRGRRWSETCTLWDEGRRYRMTVDADTYPLSYRLLLHAVSQTWSLSPTAEGTHVTLTFTAELKLGVIGTLLGNVLARRAHVGDILAAYHRELVAAAAP